MGIYTKPGNTAAEIIKYLRSFVRPGTSITITNNQVIAQMGQEQFALNQQGYELQADLEAFERIASRRLK
jgi:hypothetical protein